MSKDLNQQPPVGCGEKVLLTANNAFGWECPECGIGSAIPFSSVPNPPAALGQDAVRLAVEALAEIKTDIQNYHKRMFSQGALAVCTIQNEGKIDAALTALGAAP